MTIENALFRIQAEVALPADRPLEYYAETLKSVTIGFSLELDRDCRFDEVPALLSDRNGVELVLFGIPSGEQSDAYLLTLSTRSRKSLSDWRHELAGTFLTGLLVDKRLADSGFMDYSEELAEFFRSHGLPTQKGVEDKST